MGGRRSVRASRVRYCRASRRVQRGVECFPPRDAERGVFSGVGNARRRARDARDDARATRAANRETKRRRLEAIERVARSRARSRGVFLARARGRRTGLAPPSPRGARGLARFGAHRDRLRMTRKLARRESWLLRILDTSSRARHPDSVPRDHDAAPDRPLGVLEHARAPPERAARRARLERVRVQGDPPHLRQQLAPAEFPARGRGRALQPALVRVRGGGALGIVRRARLSARSRRRRAGPRPVLRRRRVGRGGSRRPRRAIPRPTPRRATRSSPSPISTRPTRSPRSTPRSARRRPGRRRPPPRARRF